MKLMILNLPRSFSSEELRDLFTPYGKITSLTLVMDKETGLSKGFAFIQMSSQNEAEAAIEELHGTKVLKNKIRVKLSDQNG
jgi:RNA recognition motif-containing protein